MLNCILNIVDETHRHMTSVFHLDAAFFVGQRMSKVVDFFLLVARHRQPRIVGEDHAYTVRVNSRDADDALARMSEETPNLEDALGNFRVPGLGICHRILAEARLEGHAFGLALDSQGNGVVLRHDDVWGQLPSLLGTIMELAINFERREHGRQIVNTIELEPLADLLPDL